MILDRTLNLFPLPLMFFNGSNLSLCEASFREDFRIFVEETSRCEVFIKTMLRIPIFNTFSVQCCDVAQADAVYRERLGESLWPNSAPLAGKKRSGKGEQRGWGLWFQNW